MSTIVRRGFAVCGLPAVRLFTALFVLAAVLAPEIAAPRSARAASAVTTSALNLRAGPATDQRIRLVMPEGADVEIIGGPRRGFYKVIYDGREGWAHGDYLDFGGGGGDGGGSSGSTAVLSALNLRTGPSLSSSIILVMPEGSRVDLTGDGENGFLGVVYRGTYGWAHSDYLDAGNGASDDGGGSLPTGSGGGYATVIDGALNLRAGPSTGDSIILVMPGGADVELTGDEANGFLGVIYDGTRGWAYSDYLDTGGGNGSGFDGSDGWTTEEIVAIIYDAAANYGQNGDDMLRVAQCESGLDPYNITPPYSASGLFQFLPGTWASTPYAGDDIFDPVANANAAAWMWSVGRRGEWVCL